MNYIERYWRDATPEDAIKEPPMVARFSTEGECWEHGQLVGWDRTDQLKWRSESECYEHCQVYDVPDPGEGWRLIDRDNENSLTGDEVWIEGGKWEPIQTSQYYGRRCVIRRRIEPPKPKYVPFTWEDREQLRGRWVKEGDNVEIQISALHLNSEGVFYAEGRSATVLVKRYTFLDTGEPVGKKVVQ